jgi:AraC-like DNA-binding protein
MTNSPPGSQGHLNPDDPRVSFERFALGPELDALVRHVWIVRWSVPEGEEATQRVLSYPAFNAVLETSAHEDGPPVSLTLFPPTARVSMRRLRRRGEAVGVLLRPCAGRLLLEDSGLGAGDVPPSGHPLTDAPTRDLRLALGSGVCGRVADVLSGWLAPLAQRVDERDRLVNEACRLAEEDASIDRASDLAERVGVAQRTLERTLREYLGLSPKWLIECRRLQAAATTLYVEPDAELSRLAVELGYVDYAHFSRRYRAALGETPNATRSAGREASRRRAATSP